MTPEDKFNLIAKNIRTEDVIGKTALIEKLVSGQNLKGYFGTAPTGRVHVGYLVPLLKIAECVDAGCEIIILLADVHAFLDSRKSGLEDEAKTLYYQLIITEILKLLKADISKIRFVKGSDYQYSKPYIQDVLRVANYVSVNKAKHAGAEVVKQSDDPLMSSLIYPIMQALDETYIDEGIDFELGGIDQRKIFMFSLDYVSKLTNKKCAYIMNQMIPALSKVSLKNTSDPDQKMSSSVGTNTEKIKLDLLDSSKDISTKLKQTYCLTGDVDDNTILILCKNILFPVLERLGMSFTITRNPKYGGDYVISNYDELVSEFAASKLHPTDLKMSVAKMISDLLEPIRTFFEKEDMIQLLKHAYGNADLSSNVNTKNSN